MHLFHKRYWYYNDQNSLSSVLQGLIFVKNNTHDKHQNGLEEALQVLSNLLLFGNKQILPLRHNSHNLHPSMDVHFHLTPASSGTSYASIHENKFPNWGRLSMLPLDIPFPRRHPG